MTAKIITLYNDDERRKAIDIIRALPSESRIEFKGPRRSNDQNALMWSMLTDLEEQLPWHGQTLEAEEWKDFLMHSFRRERWVSAEDGAGMVPIGMRTSKLSKEDMSQLCELILAFGARHGVTFKAVADRPPLVGEEVTPEEAEKALLERYRDDLKQAQTASDAADLFQALKTAPEWEAMADARKKWAHAAAKARVGEIRKATG